MATFFDLLSNMVYGGEYEHYLAFCCSSHNYSSSTAASYHRPISTNSRHAQLLRQFNADIFNRHVLTDVEVTVEGHVFKSHRSVLACFSPYLRRKLLSLDGKPLLNKVHVPNIDKKEFYILLQYMYTGDLKINCSNYLEIYQAASLLEMQEVIQQCLQIFDSSDEIRSYFFIYVTSKKMGIEAIWLRALRFLTHRFEEAVCATEFLELDVSNVIELLSAQSIGARSEVIVFLAALNWLKYDYPARLEYAVCVMQCVRFSSMTMDEVVACYHPPFLSELLNIPEIVTLLYRATCYITAKFLGQESWFKNYGCSKRNLAFEHLPMELWHLKDSSGIPSVDFPVSLADKKSPGDLLALSRLRESAGLGNVLDSDYSLDRMILHQNNQYKPGSQGRRRSNYYPAERDENTQGPTHNDSNHRKRAKIYEKKEPENSQINDFKDHTLPGDLQTRENNHISKQNEGVSRPSSNGVDLRKKPESVAVRESNHQQISTEENNKSRRSNGVPATSRNMQKGSLISTEKNTNEIGSDIPKCAELTKEFSVQTDCFGEARPLTEPNQGKNANPSTSEQSGHFVNLNFNSPPMKDQESRSNTPGPIHPKDSKKFSINPLAILQRALSRNNTRIVEDQETKKPSTRDVSCGKSASEEETRVDPETKKPSTRDVSCGKSASEEETRVDPETKKPSTRDVSCGKSASEEETRVDPETKKPSTRDVSCGKSASEEETRDFSTQYSQENTSVKKPSGRDVSCGESRSMTAVSSRSNVRKDSSAFALSPEISPEVPKKFKKPCILVLGGLNPKSLRTIGIGGAVLNFIPSRNKWMRYNTLPEARHNHCAAFYDNQLYVIGGCDPIDTLHQNRYRAKSSCFKLDINSQQWAEIEEMKFKRYDHAVALLEGYIFVIGGQDDGERLLKTVEVYDTKMNKWKLLSSEMCCGRKAMGATAFSKRIWIAGGIIQLDKNIYFQVVSHVDCYDPELKKWMFNVNFLPSPRFYVSLTVWRGLICCVGGMMQQENEEMCPTDQVWFYDDTTKLWKEGPALPVPRICCGALAYGDTLYVVGGFNPENDLATRNVNFLKPDTDSWEIAASLPSQLFGSSAVSSLSA